MTLMTKSAQLRLADLVEPTQNPNHFESERFELLKAAIQKKGFLQPILVREKAGRYEIIDGVHRTRAAKALGLAEVTAEIVDCDDHNAAILQIAMNRLRGDLNLAEVGAILADLSKVGMSEEDLTLSGMTVAEIEGLLDLVKPDDILEGSNIVESNEKPETQEKVFDLVLTFEDADRLKKVKSILRKAAKPSRDLAVGLEKLLGLEDGE